MSPEGGHVHRITVYYYVYYARRLPGRDAASTPACPA